MKLEKFSNLIFDQIKNRGYQYFVLSNISGILSEGDDVHNLLIPFKTKQEAENIARNNNGLYVIDMVEAEKEVQGSFIEKTGITFFIERKYLQ